MIDETTTRDELLTAIYSEGDMIDLCIARNIDPENMDDAALLSFIREWIEAGDECGAA